MRVRLAWIGWALAGLGLLAGCSESDAPDDDLTAIRAPGIARIVPASEAISGAHIPTLDPAPMNDAEILKALGEGPHCEFRYTSTGKPVLAVKARPNGAAQGVVKLNGHLVVLQSAPAENATVLEADRVRMTLTPDPGEKADGSQVEATSIFEIGNDLRAGYRGYYDCLD